MNVTFRLPKPATVEEITATFQSTAPKYRGLKGLLRKTYCLSEDGARACGIYLWESRADAESVVTQLGCQSRLLDITPIVDGYLATTLSGEEIDNVRRGNFAARDPGRSGPENARRGDGPGGRARAEARALGNPD